MTAQVLPFPATRRRRHIARVAGATNRYRKRTSAHAYIQHIIDQHRGRLRRLGVDEAMVLADADALESALFGAAGDRTKAGGVA